VRGKTIARPFAGALFELADGEGRLEEYGEALDRVVRVLDEEPLVRRFLETPQVGVDEKKKVLHEALEGTVPQPVLNFLLLVVDRRRQRFLDTMAAEYRSLLDERMGRAHVEVSVAREMDEKEVDELRRRLSGILGKEAVLQMQVKPELMGGLVFKSDDVIYDGSMRRRLDRMKQRLMAADVSTGQGL
jgi:F-type H+-transporting ATPase subunit delta